MNYCNEMQVQSTHKYLRHLFPKQGMHMNKTYLRTVIFGLDFSRNQFKLLYPQELWHREALRNCVVSFLSLSLFSDEESMDCNCVIFNLYCVISCCVYHRCYEHHKINITTKIRCHWYLRTSQIKRGCEGITRFFPKKNSHNKN